MQPSLVKHYNIRAVKREKQHLQSGGTNRRSIYDDLAGYQNKRFQSASSIKRIVPKGISGEWNPGISRNDIQKPPAYNTRARTYGPPDSRLYELTVFGCPIRPRQNGVKKKRSKFQDAEELHYGGEREEGEPDALARDTVKESINRSKRKMKLFIYCMKRPICKMITLTYAVPPLDEKTMGADMAAFLERLNYHQKQRVNAIWVYERGKKTGRFHIHIIAECGYIGQAYLQNTIWGMGIADIRKVHQAQGAKADGRLIQYLMKYIMKDVAQGHHYRHRYHRTRHSAYMCHQDVGQSDLIAADIKTISAECKVMGITTNCWECITSHMGTVAQISSYDKRFIQYMRVKLRSVKCRRRTIEPIFETDREYRRTIYTESELLDDNRPDEIVGFLC